jgi:hypothetical protein
MLVLPIESRPLLVVAPPAPQFTDRQRTQPKIDRDTGSPVVEVAVCLTSDGGQPQMLRVQVPVTGVPKDLAAGQVVKAAGLTLMVGETNGRSWQMLRAVSVATVKAP